jgi:hypothetical protein
MSKRSKLNRERVSDPYRQEVARATEAIRNAQRGVFTGPTQAQLDAYERSQAADLERALFLSDAHKREAAKTEGA